MNRTSLSPSPSGEVSRPLGNIDLEVIVGDGTRSRRKTMEFEIVKVTKEASDMVLTDDNFSIIMAAVGEGRSIYNNMKAFIRYWQGFLHFFNCFHQDSRRPATALGFNSPDKYIMKKALRRSDDSLISPWILYWYLVNKKKLSKRNARRRNTLNKVVRSLFTHLDQGAFETI
ncbi:calcium-transporting ATPase 1, endoplasmic reticulum-type-like protein [Tanacetum coccineum]|uniref:Calcium-transporting ATPase 1, endoplasmic reticulum-type-like protein n=1 Tax=Tanacetum coccineum TaxID=301880 RepID=A0ABQ5C8R1_9ASTR